MYVHFNNAVTVKVDYQIYAIHVHYTTCNQLTDIEMCIVHCDCDHAILNSLLFK